MQPDLAPLLFIAKHTPSAVLLADRHGRIEWVNDSFSRLTGYELSEVRGRRPGAVLYGPATDRTTVARMGEAQRAGRPFVEELVIYTRAGRPYRVEVHCIPIVDAAGRVCYFLAVQSDVTGRRAVEGGPGHSPDLLRLILDAISLVVFATDTAGRLTFLEGKGVERFGRSEGHVLGRSFFELWPDEALHGHVRRALAGEACVANIVIGETVFEVRSSPLCDACGVVTGCLGVALDVTEQVRATAELMRARDAAEAATRAKSVFLATMSHEIRTPLNAVIGTADLLLDLATSDEQRRYVETIRTSGDMLLAVIDDILDFSKIEAGNMELECRPFDVRALVGEVLELLAPKAGAKGLRLAAAIDVGVPAALVGDPTRIRQILVNLVGNAVKFTEGGEVLTKAYCRRLGTGEQLELELSVVDTGIGIPTDRLGRLFHPFSQVDAATTRRYGGSGLGLAICKRLAELMGGQIGVHSTEGLGSTFSVRLPVLAAGDHQREERASGRQSAADRPAPLRILLAEDNSINQEVALRMLERLGYSADTAEDGLAVLRAFEQRDYDVVLMDVQMPELDGLETTRRLRASLPASRQPRIIAITANAMVGDRDACLAAGMDDYISKPVQRASLAAALRRLPRRAVAEPSPHDDAAALDLVDVERLRADLGPEFGEELAALVETYRRQLQSDVARLRAANAAGDDERVALLAHRLRGASATLGARRVVERCRDLEQSDGPAAAREALIDAIAAAGERAAAALDQIVARAGAVQV